MRDWPFLWLYQAGFAVKGSGRTLHKEDTISTGLRLGDLLIRAGLATEQEINQALERQVSLGGRLGENLVALGVITPAALEGFLHRIPPEPENIAATGVDDTELMGLLMKLIYAGRLESVRQFAEAIKLPYHLVLELVQMAVDRKLLHTLGARDGGGIADMCYTFTDEGRRWTIDALQRVGYVGPAPVPIEVFNQQVNLQKLTSETITYARIRKALGELTVPDSIIEQCGPALNSGRAMLMYGPPGNGKTSVALRLTSVFNDIIYMPYAIIVEGQIIRVFDASLHAPVEPGALSEDNPLNLLRPEAYDERWVPCKRPFVVVGGELTLEMLDLRYDESGHFYEAPLHMKALGGCFLIDDFGRQLVSPTALLNRWIVPLESRVDYLKLHTGKSFNIPFEELIIFSTNIEPEDLMDPAFLRRLPYKIEVGPPSLANYRQIFEGACAPHGLTLTDPIFEAIVYKLREEKGLDLAAYQPRFIVDQIIASCRFMEQPPQFEPRFIEYALDNLRVHRIKPAESSDG